MTTAIVLLDSHLSYLPLFRPNLSLHYILSVQLPSRQLYLGDIRPFSLISKTRFEHSTVIRTVHFRAAD